MKVKELIIQLLDEDLDSEIVVHAEGNNFWGIVDIEGIWSERRRVGSVILEPSKSLMIEIKP